MFWLFLFVSMPVKSQFTLIYMAQNHNLSKKTSYGCNCFQLICQFISCLVCKMSENSPSCFVRLKPQTPKIKILLTIKTLQQILTFEKLQQENFAWLINFLSSDPEKTPPQVADRGVMPPPAHRHDLEVIKTGVVVELQHGKTSNNAFCSLLILNMSLWIFN